MSDKYPFYRLFWEILQTSAISSFDSRWIVPWNCVKYNIGLIRSLIFPTKQKFHSLIQEKWLQLNLFLATNSKYYHLKDRIGRIEKKIKNDWTIPFLYEEYTQHPNTSQGIDRDYNQILVLFIKCSNIVIHHICKFSSQNPDS